MQDRRTFLGIAAASLLPLGLNAQAPAPRPPTELARHPLTGPFEGFEVVLVELNIAPGARSAGHRHPGPEAWYVVSGAQCLETPNGLIVASAGGGAMVPEGWPMAISSVGAETRRALVLILHRSDQPYSMAVDDHRSHGAPHSDWKPLGLCAKWHR